jgi:hypothetical protein
MAISGAWTVEEKRAIIAEYESAPHGEKGLVLCASPRIVEGFC